MEDEDEDILEYIKVFVENLPLQCTKCGVQSGHCLRFCWCRKSHQRRWRLKVWLMKNVSGKNCHGDRGGTSGVVTFFCYSGQKVEFLVVQLELGGGVTCKLKPYLY